MRKLFFVRHGLSEMNKLGIYSGSTETNLAPEGREQAREAGKSAKGLGIDKIISSPMGRAKETAQIIAKEIGYPLEAIEHNGLLVERNMGALEGQPWDPDTNMDGIADIETTDTLLQRARLALLFLENQPRDTILVVSHGATGRALRHVIDPSIPFYPSPRFENAQIVQLL